MYRRQCDATRLCRKHVTLAVPVSSFPKHRFVETLVGSSWNECYISATRYIRSIVYVRHTGRVRGGPGWLCQDFSFDRHMFSRNVSSFMYIQIVSCIAASRYPDIVSWSISKFAGAYLTAALAPPVRSWSNLKQFMCTLAVVSLALSFEFLEVSWLVHRIPWRTWWEWMEVWTLTSSDIAQLCTSTTCGTLKCQQNANSSGHFEHHSSLGCLGSELQDHLMEQQEQLQMLQDLIWMIEIQKHNLQSFTPSILRQFLVCKKLV